MLVIPLTGEDDNKRRNPHLAFPSLNKCNVVRATAAAIAREKRNLESVLPSQHSTEIPGRSSQTAVLTVSPCFHLGRRESPLGNYSNHSPKPLRATLLRLPAALEVRVGGAKHVALRATATERPDYFLAYRPVGASLCEAWGRRPQGDGYGGSGATD